MHAISSALLATALLMTAAPAAAQLILPGAVGGQSGTAAPAPSGGGGGGAPLPKPKPVIIRAPSEDTVIGHDLSRDGAAGTMTIERSGKDLAITHLSLQGDEISKPGEQCRVDIGLPITTRLLGRPAGVSRYEAALEACPFAFDVLDGAVLVSADKRTCEFTAADCRVEPAGLWGPAGNSFTPARTKEMEHARISAESNMRANFRALLSHAGKDKYAVKAIAGEQAGFSSRREETCRDYARETVHGFCAWQITEARALALLAKLGAGEDGKPVKVSAKPKRKPKPVAPTAPVAMPGEVE